MDSQGRKVVVCDNGTGVSSRVTGNTLGVGCHLPYVCEREELTPTITGSARECTVRNPPYRGFAHPELSNRWHCPGCCIKQPPSPVIS